MLRACICEPLRLGRRSWRGEGAPAEDAERRWRRLDCLSGDQATKLHQGAAASTCEWSRKLRRLALENGVRVRNRVSAVHNIYTRLV